MKKRPLRWFFLFAVGIVQGVLGRARRIAAVAPTAIGADCRHLNGVSLRVDAASPPAFASSTSR